MGLVKFKPETKKEVAMKWITIPLTMILIMVVGAPINLHKHFALGKNPHSELFRIWSLIGQYLVILPGFLYKKKYHRFAMEFSSLVLIISYIFLGSMEMYRVEVPVLDVALIAFGCFTANLASTVVIFTAISLCVSNFSHDEDLLLPIIISAHLLTAGHFDENFRDLLLHTLGKLKLSIFFYITAGYVGFISLLFSWLIKTRTIKSLIIEWLFPDTFAVTLFVLYCALFLEIMIGSQIVQQNQYMTVAVFLIGAAIYLYIPYFFRRIIKDQLVKLKGLKLVKSIREVSLSECLKDSKFILMCVVSPIVKGTSLTTIHYIKEIGIVLKKFHEVEHLQKSLWIMAVTAVFLGGILVIFFRKYLHAYFFLSFAPLLCIFGFYYFLGIGYGLVSVIVPQIILFGGGQADFIQTWGFIYLWDLLGILIMNLLVKSILLWKYEYNLTIYFVIWAFLNLVLFVIWTQKYCRRKLKKKERKAEKRARRDRNRELKLQRSKSKSSNKTLDKSPRKERNIGRDSYNAFDLGASTRMKI